MAEFKLDCLYEACPIPLLKAHKKLMQMKIGDVLILETDHNCSIVNVIDWVKKQGHNVDYVEISEGQWEIYIEKAK